MTFNFKKKSAFPLAETLITLAIIGIIAAITIPNMIAKYKKQELKSRFQQASKIIADAQVRFKAEEGITFDEAFITYGVSTLATIVYKYFPTDTKTLNLNKKATLGPSYHTLLNGTASER